MFFKRTFQIFRRHFEIITTFATAQVPRNAARWPWGLNGNAVKAGNSSRCCEFPPRDGGTKGFDILMPLSFGTGRRRNRNESEDLPVTVRGICPAENGAHTRYLWVYTGVNIWLCACCWRRRSARAWNTGRATKRSSNPRRGAGCLLSTRGILLTANSLHGRTGCRFQRADCRSFV